MNSLSKAGPCPASREDGVSATVADPVRVDAYVRADSHRPPSVIVEDTGKQQLKRVVTAIRDAGGSLLYILHVNGMPNRRGQDELRAVVPEITHLDLAELLSPTLTTELGRSLTRARVQQYQRYFADADRVLIMLHNEPDPDALAAGLAFRNVLRRTRTTAIIGAMQGVRGRKTCAWPTCSTSRSSRDAGGLRRLRSHRDGRRPAPLLRRLLPRVDLVVDHHPEQPGYTAVFKDIRADYGSTCTILTEHLRAVDVNISERTATAMLYAIKSDTLFFARQTNRVDLEAFTFLYPLADPALIRKMEGADITLERLEHVTRALATSRLRSRSSRPSSARRRARTSSRTPRTSCCRSRT